MNESWCNSYVVVPVAPTVARLGGSTNAVEAYPTHDGAMTYALGARVIGSITPGGAQNKVGGGFAMQRIFESLAASNAAPLSDGTKWLNVGPSNAMAMFTNRLSEQTVTTGPLVATVTPFQYVDAVSFFGLQGQSITLDVLSNAGAVISTETVDLIHRPAVADLISFFFAPFEQKTQVLFTNLVCVPGNKLRVTVSAESPSQAKCGRMIYGALMALGSAPQYGASIEMDNYTSSDPDEFGNVNIVARDYAWRQQVSIYVEPGRSNFVLGKLVELRDTPVVFIGVKADQYTNAMVNFGLIKSPSYVLSGPTHNVLDVEIKGYV